MEEDKRIRTYVHRSTSTQARNDANELWCTIPSRIIHNEIIPGTNPRYIRTPELEDQEGQKKKTVVLRYEVVQVKRRKFSPSRMPLALSTRMSHI